jgi:secreted PhoX family phosphatase
MSQQEDWENNRSNNAHMNDVVRARLADPGRRQLLKGTGAWAALSFIGGTTALVTSCGGSDDVAQPAVGPQRPAALGFNAVAKSTADSVVVAAGYSVKVLIRLGDPIAANVPAYRNDGTDAAASFEFRAGDHHDALHYFGLLPDGKYGKNESNRGLLCINHEAITPMFLHQNGVTTEGSGTGQRRTVAEEVLREFYAHGVTIIEVRRNEQSFDVTYVQNSPFNRRIHTLTPMALSGPAAGTPYMVTKYSPDGRRTRGTINNCAHGYTPWGTYLTCEENWAGYFRRIAAADDPQRSAKELVSLARYGIRGNGRELWATVTPDTPDDLFGRWNAEVRGATAADDYRNAPNTFGWNVEIDPFDPYSTPKKRTAMGRFAHEGAWPAKVEAGKPLVFYMGCDARNEYIYKYVSKRPWDPADAGRGLAAGDKYLDDGTLYAARFNADGTGQWLPLDIDNPAIKNYAGYAFADQADVLINTRLAADAVGATKMDRPEWGAVDPVTGAVYMTLTNNNGTFRSLAATDAANPRHYNDQRTNGANQRGNPNGHIIRWQEATPDATSFRWDIYLFGARSTADATNVNLSGLSADNDFSSPDGVWFSPATNICWIQTDDGAYTDVTNCMLLAALPGAVGDGGARTITNADAAGNTKQVQTFVGAPPGARLKRFLVGPVECEITGLAETPDGKTLFINIQHPGEDTPPAVIGDPTLYRSHWPDGGLARPRSATVVITRADKGLIGV